MTALWLVTIVPLAIVLIEYRSVQLCGESLGWFLAKLYGSIFLYPLLFGTLALIAIFPPLVAATHYLGRYPRLGRLLLGATVLAVALIAVVEFTGSKAAPFEVAVAGYGSVLGIDYLAERQAAFCSQSDKTGKADLTIQTESLLAEFGRSATGFAYYFAVVGIVIQQILGLVVLATFFNMKYSSSRYLYLFRGRTLVLIGSALFFGSLWCLYRLTFRLEEPLIYTQTSGFVGDYAVVGAYVLFFAFFISSFWIQIEKMKARASIVIQAGAWALGVLSLHFAVDSRFVFGSKASVANLVVILLLLAVVSFFWMFVTNRVDD